MESSLRRTHTASNTSRINPALHALRYFKSENFENIYHPPLPPSNE